MDGMYVTYASPIDLLARWARVSEKQRSKLAPTDKVQDAPRCECGGEKCKTTHSHWCPCRTGSQ